MKYFNVNFNALKNYIMDKKEQYDNMDILCLFDMGIINQQQYEDLMTIVHRPIYDYKHFYQENKGYYHTQGPLTQQQSLKSITATTRLKHKK